VLAAGLEGSRVAPVSMVGSPSEKGLTIDAVKDPLKDGAVRPIVVLKVSGEIDIGSVEAKLGSSLDLGVDVLLGFDELVVALVELMGNPAIDETKVSSKPSKPGMRFVNYLINLGKKRQVPVLSAAEQVSSAEMLL